MHRAETADPDHRYGASDGGVAAVTSRNQTEDGVSSRTEQVSRLSGPADRDSEYADVTAVVVSCTPGVPATAPLQARNR